MGWRRPGVPLAFWRGLESFSRADLVEILWDVLHPEPGDDAGDVPQALDRLTELRMARREERSGSADK